MVGSRLEKVGTVFTRVRNLMRTGVIKPHEKPIWFDVYAAFPPKRDPLYIKPASQRRPKRPDTVPEIFYAEDPIRAKFYKIYWAGPAPLELSKPNFISISQRFVEEYEALKKSSELDDDALFEETGKSLLAQGFTLKRKTLPGTPRFKTKPVLDLNPNDMLSELKTPTTEEENLELFAEEYEELPTSAELDNDALFEETGESLQAQGKGTPAVAPDNSEPVLDLNLNDRLPEQKTPTKTEEEETTAENSPPKTTI